jgi:hypothetical protein
MVALKLPSWRHTATEFASPSKRQTQSVSIVWKSTNGGIDSIAWM